MVVFIVYIILALLKNIKDNKNTLTNRSQLHKRLQYNFYWFFIIQLEFNTISLNKQTKLKKKLRF